MKMKFRTSVIAKVIAWFLIAVTGLGIVGSILLAIAMQEAGFYEYTYAQLQEQQFAVFSDRYSARVLEYLGEEDNSNKEYFESRNFKYGVIEADFLSEIERMDLNDERIYLERNFEEPVTLEDMHIFQCTLNEYTTFHSQNPDSPWGYYWISNTGGSWTEFAIDTILYDVESGIFFCATEAGYYPIPQVVFQVENGKEVIERAFAYDRKNICYHLITDAFTYEAEYGAALKIKIKSKEPSSEIKKVISEIDMIAEEEIRFYFFYGTVLDPMNLSEAWLETWEMDSENEVYEMDSENEVYEMPIENVDTIYTDMTYIDIAYDSLAYEESIQYSKAEVRLGENGLRVYVKPEEDASKSYYVLSYLPDTHFYNGDDLTQADAYAKYDIIVGTLYNMRYQIYGILVFCLIVFLSAFIFLCCAAGHRQGQTELAESPIQKIPLEIYGSAVLVIEFFTMLALDRVIGDFTRILWIIATVLLVLFAGIILTIAALEVVTRIKLRIFWKRTILYWAVRKLFGGCRQVFRLIREHTGMVLKLVLIFGGITFADLMILILSINRGSFGLVFFLIEKVILFVMILSLIVQLRALKDGGQHIAKGDMEYRIDTKGMFWDFKKHGENLNSISEGLSLAVEERMKSERFKTELITNVSHDIKTPLTSIINYVDLLQKEEIENANAQEYLEVLERQSARLKKLLEDLLEVSKASAGTLQVGLETLEAGVFMVQTVGEFEEKTKAQKLELVIKKPEEDVYIRADGRHFWRVIDNLMNNICKYAQPDTRVYINLEATKQEVYITFRNTSRYPLNISSEELMERFVRGDASRNTEGSGLGLSIAQSLMELMGGTFELVVDGDLFKVILVFNRVDSEVTY